MHVRIDEIFMQRALELAELGRGKVSPNPMVGCVIVKEGKIIGEGYHMQYGGPHAEVNAINSVKDKNDLTGSILYVSLEPCAHFGKTPPCADLIVQFPFKKVVICNTDPNPLVAGKGIGKLKNAGIEVTEGVLANEGLEINKRFFTYITEKRPFIILKWAETQDRYIARKDFSSKWISNDLSRKLVHKWRSEEDAVIVGTNTVLYDNPRLNVREWKGRDPLRVFIDRELKTPKDFYLLDQSQPTICYNYQKSESKENLEWVKIESSENILEFILKDLYKRKVQSLIVEGGCKLLQMVIDAGLWDEARVFRSKTTFEEGICSPQIKGKIISRQVIENDELLLYNPG